MCFGHTLECVVVILEMRTTGMQELEHMFSSCIQAILDNLGAKELCKLFWAMWRWEDE